MRWGCRYSDIALEISGEQFAEYRICISLQINRLCSGSDFRVAHDFYCVSGSQTRKGKIRHLELRGIAFNKKSTGGVLPPAEISCDYDVRLA